MKLGFVFSENTGINLHYDLQVLVQILELERLYHFTLHLTLHTT